MSFWQSYEYREDDKQVKWDGEGTLQKNGRTRAGEGGYSPWHWAFGVFCKSQLTIVPNKNEKKHVHLHQEIHWELF